MFIRIVMNNKTLVISLGGSINVPDKIDVDFLKKFRKLILDYVKEGNKVVIITGGGKVCRRYIESAGKIADVKAIDNDWVGIMATRLNAELVRAIFSENAYEKVAVNPTKKVDSDKRIIIGCGWQPGCSSDMDAVLFAKNVKADTLVNLSNIEFVYDKDPNKFKNAKKLEKVSWKEFRKIVGDEWKAGMNLPFDPVASKEAEKIGLKVVIMKGTDLENFKSFLENKVFKGTVIS